MATRIRYRRCKICGTPGTESSPISSRGKCADCGDLRQIENVNQLRLNRGPFFEGWYDEMHLRFQHRRLPRSA